MTGMKNLSRILSELANHGSWEGYGLLNYAIMEAVKAQPMPVNMDQLCEQLVGIGDKRNPKSIYRSMARAVDDIWAKPESRPLLKEYYHRELVEKPTLDSFICALARYLWEQAAAPQLYEIIFDQVSEKYGIISHIGDPKIWAAFPAITADKVLVEQIVSFLCDKEIPPEIFKNFYLSGGLLCDPE